MAKWDYCSEELFLRSYEGVESGASGLHWLVLYPLMD